MKIVKNVHDFSEYPPNLRPFVKILLKYEQELSDGYGYYCGSRLHEVLTKLATELQAVENEKIRKVLSLFADQDNWSIDYYVVWMGSDYKDGQQEGKYPWEIASHALKG
ncbi:unnamed protein product, partial [marine sediment metagenome]